MAVFDHPDFDDHEHVSFFFDRASGLKSIIAIHNTNRGPALGGCRMWAYDNDQEAITDVLRLSQGMTYKAAIADLALGGGKSVIIGDSKTDKSEQLMQKMGRAVERLGGLYIVAEDVGTTVPDMDIVRSETKHVAGVSGGAGDPSPSTAHGVFVGIRAAVKHKLGKDSTAGLTVAVQGLGAVGYSLCEWLNNDGAKLIVTDISEEAIKRAVDEFGATAVGVDDIYDADADVFAPCALGASINDETIPRLKVSIVSGSANNQLAEDRHGEVLRQRDVLYAPDYVVNAGGLIDVARFAIDIDLETAKAKLEQIYDTLIEIFARADREGAPTNHVADRIAEERFRKQT
ncbi:MAG: Glu/Leu/Phe/Val dehydrogenase [Alphaproteobacteria bacterium]|nr:Glu/Leu/Phe/Val dehydrogenase [Alphaproteobacteria bacterium]